MLNEPAFTARFHRLCKQFLIDGAAEPDREKPDVEQRLGDDLTGAVFHGWGASEAAIDGFIMSFVRTAADYLNRSARGLDYCLREVLGKALHAAQDKAAHMTPCRTAAGVACNPREMDIPRINAEGWRRAFENTRIVFRQLDPLLTPNSRHWLANGPTR